MLRRARLSFVLLLAVTCVMPTAALAADPLPEGAVRTDDGRVLLPLPEELQAPSVHAQMLTDHATDTMHFTPGGAPSVVLGATDRPEMAGASVEPMGTLAQVSATGL